MLNVNAKNVNLIWNKILFEDSIKQNADMPY